VANEIRIKDGAAIVFGVSGSFAPAAAGTKWASAITNALTLSGLANLAGRQSAKVDLGATRAARYAVLGCVDFTGETPTAGLRVDYYWAPATSATTAEGNVAGNNGTDAAAPGGGIGATTLGPFLLMCDFIGSLVVSAVGAVQNGVVGIFVPKTRWGQLIVVNNSGDVFETDDVEAHQVLVPIVDEMQ
jgi:hypothetical protein